MMDLVMAILKNLDLSLETAMSLETGLVTRRSLGIVTQKDLGLETVTSWGSGLERRKRRDLGWGKLMSLVTVMQRGSSWGTGMSLVIAMQKGSSWGIEKS
jgi:hypothetical protein